MNGDRVSFGGQHEIYYEFEALVTAAKRAYDATRYVLWRQFGPLKGSVPSSFDRTIIKLPRLPAELRHRLEQSWENYGVHLSDYRNCIQHYVPLGGPAPFTTIIRKNGLLMMIARIPDNPEARSDAKFTYVRGLDALDYGWKVANEVFDIAKAILAAARTMPAA